MKRNLLTMLASVVLLAGCGTKWTKPGITEQAFYVDSAQCQALANGAAPLQPVPSPTMTSYTSGLYSQNGSVGTYSGTTTTYNPAASGAQLGNAVAMWQQEKIYKSCMYERGYTEAP